MLAGLPPTRLPSPAVQDLRLYDARPGSGVLVSFIETGRARIPGWMLYQGAGLGARDVVFRAALIEHPTRTILFSTGVDVAGPQGLVYNPFRRVTATPPPADLPAIDSIVLPTPRWFHTGGAQHWPALAETSIVVGRSDAWQASERASWPRRYAFEPARLEALGDRVARIPWTNTRRLGLRRSVDMSQDGSIIAIALKGSSIDEIALMITLDSGRRMLLVGDTVWAQAQVTDRRPRGLWSTWLMDRNRMQLGRIQNRLHQAWRDYDLEIIPLFDATLDLPVYPERWE